MSKKNFLLAKIVFLSGFIFLFINILYGIIAHDILVEGGIMLGVFWGKFTLIDIYIAFLVFYFWVAYREEKSHKRVLWFILIMCGGSMSICLYMFLAIKRCHNNMHQLLLGDRSTN